jgi:hypothetical protein
LTIIFVRGCGIADSSFKTTFVPGAFSFLIHVLTVFCYMAISHGRIVVSCEDWPSVLSKLLNFIVALIVSTIINEATLHHQAMPDSHVGTARISMS